MPYKLKLEKHPNNETRITLYPVRRKPQTLREKAAEFLGVAADELVPLGESGNSTFHNSPSLDIRSEFRTVCSAHSYQRTQFGKFAKTRIMRSAGAMDKKDPCPWHYLFLTATLPSSSEWAKWAIAEESPWIIDTIKSWLSKRINQRLEFYVWEMQDRGALHFHWCLHVPDEAMRQKITEEFRLEWCRILDGVEKRTGVSMWGRFAHLSPTAQYCIVQVKVEQIRKSVAAYMAGYCGGKKDKHEKDKFIPYYPRRWFGVSRSLSAVVKNLTETDIGEYDSYAEAIRAYEINREYFDEDVVTSKEWCHTVGVGKTSVHYHTHAKQVELWQLKNPMLIKPQHYPNASAFLKNTASLIRTHNRLMESSPELLQFYSKASAACLMDGLYLQSIQRGALRDVTVRAIEDLFKNFPSQSSCHPSQKRLLIAARIFCRTYSQNHSKIRWNSHGWMEILTDFDKCLDKPEKIHYGGTTAQEAATPGENAANLAANHGHTDQFSPPHQFELFSWHS